MTFSAKRDYSPSIAVFQSFFLRTGQLLSTLLSFIPRDFGIYPYFAPKTLDNRVKMRIISNCKVKNLYRTDEVLPCKIESSSACCWIITALF